MDKQTSSSMNQERGVGNSAITKEKQRNEDQSPDNSHVDQQEGEMNNGELGAGFEKEEKDLDRR